MRQHAAASEHPTKPYLYTEPKLWQYLVERPSSVGRGGNGFSLVGIVSSHRLLTNQPLTSLSSKQLLFDNSPTPVHHLLHRKLVPAHVGTNFGPRKNLRKLTRSHFRWLSACLIRTGKTCTWKLMARLKGYLFGFPFFLLLLLHWSPKKLWLKYHPSSSSVCRKKITFSGFFFHWQVYFFFFFWYPSQLDPFVVHSNEFSK